MRRPSETRHHAVLGTIRRCPGCRQWWPDDAEFFYSTTYTAGSIAVAKGRSYVRTRSGVTRRCKACHVESKRRSHERARLRTAHNRRMTEFCQADGCPVRVPPDRTLCNGCAGRTAGPLTPERIRAHLNAFRAGTMGRVA